MLNKKQRDCNDITVPHDHEGVTNDNLLIRGISRVHIVNHRVSSAAFKSSSDPYKGMSIDLGQINDARSYNTGNYVGAVKLLAAIPRDKELLVGYDPLPSNDAHGQIWRYDGTVKNITGGQANYMKRNSEWHVEIIDVALS